MTKTDGLRAQTVRRRNLALVFDTVRSGSATRSELVSSTGLTRSAIGGLVGELVSLGLVREDEPRSDGRPGRPSPVVHVDDRHVAALAVDIGVDSVAVAIVGVAGIVIRSTRVAMPSAHAKPERICALVVDLAAELNCVDGHADGRRLVGVGVAIPALVRRASNVVALAPNLDWRDVALGELLGHEFATRLNTELPVIVSNEADLAGIAEVRFGAAAPCENLLFVHGGVGVGGALMAGGARVTGHHGFGGEVGHVPVNPNGSECHCGSRGCWETEIGMRSLLSRAGLAGAGDGDDVGATMRLLVDAVESGDERVISAIAEHGRWVAFGLAGLINIVDPEMIVLGGALGRLLPMFEESMELELRARRFRGVARSVPVVASKLGVDAPLIGAAQIAFGALVDDPFGVVRSEA